MTIRAGVASDRDATPACVLLVDAFDREGFPDRLGWLGSAKAVYTLWTARKGLRPVREGKFGGVQEA